MYQRISFVYIVPDAPLPAPIVAPPPPPPPKVDENPLCFAQLMDYGSSDSDVDVDVDAAGPSIGHKRPLPPLYRERKYIFNALMFDISLILTLLFCAQVWSPGPWHRKRM